MKLIGCPASKMEPQKIVAFNDKGNKIFELYVDGSMSISNRLLYPNEDALEIAYLISKNFHLFYNNIENVNGDDQA